MSSILTTLQYSELEAWLRTHQLPLIESKKFHRNYSDGTVLAKLLHKLYPKLVDLNNYPSCSSVSQKLANWTTLNQKILRKLGIQQSEKSLKNLANAECGAIEKLLFNLMKTQKHREEEQERSSMLSDQCASEHELIENNDIMIVNVNKLVGHGLVQVPQKMILYGTYENLKAELEAKELVITHLRQRVENLEKRLAMKDSRIGELLKSLAGRNSGKIALDSASKLKSNPSNADNLSQCMTNI